MRKMICVLCIVVPMLFSCEKGFFDDQATGDPYVNFKYLWDEVDKKYSYFELKEIDWDEVFKRYSEQIDAKMSEEALFNLLAGMLNELRDDHTNLFSPFNTSSYNLPLQKDFNYNKNTVRKYYIPNAMRTGSFQHDFLPGGDVAYVRYSSFMDPVDDASLDIVIERYKQTKGIVLDLRENGGGDIMNMPRILERFVSERKVVAYSKFRNGVGRNDFSEPTAIYLNPSNHVSYGGKVVVLIDRGSYSATTFFSLATKPIPSIVLMGDTTGGGGGMPNGGQLPNGWTYRFSISQVLDLDYKNYAEKGVPPDVVVSFDWSNLTRDEIIDAAVQEIRAVE